MHFWVLHHRYQSGRNKGNGALTFQLVLTISRGNEGNTDKKPAVSRLHTILSFYDRKMFDTNLFYLLFGGFFSEANFANCTPTTFLIA